MTRETLIVGHGITGQNLENEILYLHPDIADKKYDDIYTGHFYTRDYAVYDLIFICVDTPYESKSNPCDLTAIHEVVDEYSTYLKDDGIFVIKSTVLPGTTEMLNKKYGYKFVFSPEYYGDTINCNSYTFDFTILGGKKEDCLKVEQIIMPCFTGQHSFRITDSKTAELTKYMENCYLATKVSFCNQFYNISKRLGINYEELRELFILDPRITGSHTLVYDDQPYWESHCLDKDVRALAETFDAELIKNVIEFNENQKH